MRRQLLLVATMSLLWISPSYAEDEAVSASEDDLYAALEERRLLSSSDRSETLIGIDKNKNRVRDDIEKVLLRIKDHESQAAAIRLAEAYGTVMSLDLGLDPIVSSYRELSNASVCAAKLTKTTKMLNQEVSWLKAVALMVANSQSRREHLDRFFDKADAEGLSASEYSKEMCGSNM